LNYEFAKQKYSVGFEVLTGVVMKISIFCDIMPCDPLKDNQYPVHEDYGLPDLKNTLIYLWAENQNLGLSIFINGPYFTVLPFYY
jgi:hypothetical protein